jgi:hypothetical protein
MVSYKTKNMFSGTGTGLGRVLLTESCRVFLWKDIIFRWTNRLDAARDGEEV